MLKHFLAPLLYPYIRILNILVVGCLKNDQDMWQMFTLVVMVYINYICYVLKCFVCILIYLCFQKNKNKSLIPLDLVQETSSRHK